METSSIVSFSNDSTLKPEYGGLKEVNVHELALHAMRDRCLLLQRRINSLENDNMQLKLLHGDSESFRPLDGDERYQLRRQLADLTKQKSQLMHHVFMVTCENKNLWNRLATLKKSLKREMPQSNFSAIESTPPKQAKLLRTNTYIQSSTPKVDASQEKCSDISLEEISLKLINSYIQERSQLVEQYEQMAEIQSEDDFINLDSVGFAYIDDHSTDSLKEVRIQTEKIMQMKKELSKQEADLMTILSNMEKILDKKEKKCPNCAARETNQVATENKEIETSDSLGEWATPVQSTTYHEETVTDANTLQSLSQRETTTEQAISSTPPTEEDKICPMCGQVFKKGCTFAEFQQHVENHFIGDPDPDSMDYDLVAHSVNDFI